MLVLELHIGESIRYCPLPEGRFVLGRSESCDVPVDDPAVSREHVRIRVSGETVEILDLDSANGLWVGGERVRSATLGVGQSFSTGTVLVVVRSAVTVGTPGQGREKRAESVDRLPPRTTADGAEASPAPPSADDPGFCRRLLLDLTGRPLPPDEMLGAVLSAVLSLNRAHGGAILAQRHRTWQLLVARGAAIPESWEEAIADGSREEPRTVSAAGTEVLVVPTPHGPDGAVGLLLIYPAPTAPVGLELLIDAIAAHLGHPDSPDRGAGKFEGFHAPAGFLAVSEPARRLLVEVDRLAASDLPVLLVGESGTGKELLAQRLHRRSRRGAGPFIALNCSSFPKDLVEAELFGIHKGVATGVAERQGRFQQASAGTLFLDEIADLPLELQPKLLRAIESGVVLPVGAPQPVKIDVRILSATHRDLRKEAHEGGFRQDLLYRLAGAEVRVPPLRERPEDILPLSRYFSREASSSSRTPFFGIDLEAAKALLGYSWPGNVRELRHVIGRAAALADGPFLHEGLLPPEVRGEADRVLGDALLGLREDWRTASERFARLYFRNLFEKYAENLTEAAKKAGVSRSTLYARLAELGLRPFGEGDD